MLPALLRLDSNQILHNDKNYKVLFVGGPNTHSFSKFKMTVGRQFKKLNHNILQMVQLIATKFATTYINNVNHNGYSNFKFQIN